MKTKNKDTTIGIMVAILVCLIIVFFFALAFLVTDANGQTFKIRSWQEDKWDSKQGAELYRYQKINQYWDFLKYDKPLHGGKALFISGITDYAIHKNWIPTRIIGLPSILVIGCSESILQEVYDGFDWKRTGGAEVKDLLAGIGGTTAYWGFTKLSTRAKIYTFILAGSLIYKYSEGL